MFTRVVELTSKPRKSRELSSLINDKIVPILRFPDCETGAMPPFGNLYDMPVFADESLARDKEIAFNAGSHRELVRLAWDDFVRLVEPKIVRFGGGSIHSTAA